MATSVIKPRVPGDGLCSECATPYLCLLQVLDGEAVAWDPIEKKILPFQVGLYIIGLYTIGLYTIDLYTIGLYTVARCACVSLYLVGWGHTWWRALGAASHQGGCVLGRCGGGARGVASYQA